jgi:hypothetical protein
MSMTLFARDFAWRLRKVSDGAFYGGAFSLSYTLRMHATRTSRLQALHNATYDRAYAAAHEIARDADRKRA